jgi:hypothetical protein
MGLPSDPAEWFGEAEFEFGGERFRLTFDNMALIEAEGALRESMLDWLPQLHLAIKAGQNPQMRHLAALVYGGLRNNHPEITQKQVVNMVVAQDSSLRDAIKRALVAIELPEDALAPAGGAAAVGNAQAGNRRQRRAAKAAK